MNSGAIDLGLVVRAEASGSVSLNEIPVTLPYLNDTLLMFAAPCSAVITANKTFLPFEPLPKSIVNISKGFALWNV